MWYRTRLAESTDAIDLCLMILRNLLMIPNPKQALSDLELYLHDRLILKLAQSSTLEILPLMSHWAQSQARSTNMFLLEVLAGLFRMETGEDVNGAGRCLGLHPPESITDHAGKKEAAARAADHSVAKLSSIMQGRGKYGSAGSLLAQSQTASRHSRFGNNTYVEKKLMGGRTQFVTNPFGGSDYLPSDAASLRIQAKRLVAENPRRTYLNEAVRDSLYDCASTFLEYGYSGMSSVIEPALASVCLHLKSNV